MADETKMIDVILGPYRGHRLTVSAADADAAVNNHLKKTDANAPPPEPDHEPHPPLSDAERTAALDAAEAWAKQTWATAQGIQLPKPPPPGRWRSGRARGVFSRLVALHVAGNTPHLPAAVARAVPDPLCASPRFALPMPRRHRAQRFVPRPTAADAARGPVPVAAHWHRLPNDC